MFIGTVIVLGVLCLLGGKELALGLVKLGFGLFCLAAVFAIL